MATISAADNSSVTPPSAGPALRGAQSAQASAVNRGANGAIPIGTKKHAARSARRCSDSNPYMVMYPSSRPASTGEIAKVKICARRSATPDNIYTGAGKISRSGMDHTLFGA